MKQSKAQSIVETIFGTVTGLIISYWISKTVYLLYGFHISDRQNIEIVLIFTVISLLRGYLVRRLFNNEYFIEFLELLRIR